MGFPRLNPGGKGSCLNFCVLVKGSGSEGSCLGHPLSSAAPSRLAGGESGLGFENSGMQK